MAISSRVPVVRVSEDGVVHSDGGSAALCRHAARPVSPTGFDRAKPLISAAPLALTQLMTELLGGALEQSIRG